MKLLLEDYQDDILASFNKLHPETKRLLVGDANANFLNGGVDKSKLFPITGSVEYNWDRAWNDGDKQDRELLADAFIKYQENTYNYDLQSVLDVMLHIMNDLGLKQADNPFFKLLADLQKDGIKVGRDDLIKLNNLYATGELDFDHVKSSKSLLYNKELWTKLDAKQREQIIKYWLYVIRNKNSYSEEPVDKGVYANVDSVIRGLIKQDPSNPEKYIFVDNKGTLSGGNLRPVDQIIRFVDRHFLKRNIEDKVFDKGEKKSDSDNKQSQLLTDKKKAIDKAISEGNLRYSDVKEIMKYLEELHKSGILK